jgi:ABC-2 type transport system permease protein
VACLAGKPRRAEETARLSRDRALLARALHQGPIVLTTNSFSPAGRGALGFSSMFRRLRRYAEVYAIMLRNSLIREMAFKANFLLWMGVELLWFIGQIVFLEVIFGYVDRIGDWTKWEVVLLVGTHQLIAQVFQAFFYSNLANLPELIRTGRLDFMLLQPIDTQFAVSTKQFGLDNLVNALIGVAFVVAALIKLGVAPSPAQVALYLAAIGMGVMIHYAVLFCLAATSFWIVRSQGLIYGYYGLFNLGRYPDVVFRGLFKFVFSWVIPIIVVTNVPARLLIRGADSPAPLLLQLLLATAIVTVLTRLFWRAALKRYASASS